MKLCGFDVGLDQPFFLIAGTCSIEGLGMSLEVAGQLQAILDRYPDQPKPSVDHLINLVVAPSVFRILFSTAPLEVGELQGLVGIALSQ